MGNDVPRSGHQEIFKYVLDELEGAMLTLNVIISSADTLVGKQNIQSLLSSH